MAVFELANGNTSAKYMETKPIMTQWFIPNHSFKNKKSRNPVRMREDAWK